MSREPSSAGRRRAVAPVGLLLAAAALVVALVALRPGGPAGSRPAASGVAASSAAVSAGGQASGGGTGTPRSLPPGLEDRGWITETATQRWLAGSLSGRVLLLPRDEIAFAATSSQVASAQYATNGTSTTLRIRDLADGRLRVSVDRPGAITSGAFGKGVLYVSGDPAVVGQSDGGVQAVALADGSVTDVIAPGPAPTDAAGPVSRFQLRLDPTGRYLGSGLCSADLCTIDIVDLASGTRTTPFRNAHGSLLALTRRTLFLVNDTSTALDAVDASNGTPLWHLGDVQIAGITPTPDGSRVLVAYLQGSAATGLLFQLASADAASGALRSLLQRAADTDVPAFYPGLSGDQFAVIGSAGGLAALAPGAIRRAALTLVDTRTGATAPDAVTITAP